MILNVHLLVVMKTIKKMDGTCIKIMQRWLNCSFSVQNAHFCYSYDVCFFYVHGSVYRKYILINVQRDATIRRL